MRRSVPVLACVALLLLCGALPLHAEVTRTVRAELPAGQAARFAVENLAGSITVLPGDAREIIAIATIHAESDELAQQVSFATIETEGQAPILRLRYPLGEHGTIRFPARGDGASSGHSGDGGFLSGLFGCGLNTSGHYDGHRVKISSASGVLLYADLEVRLPAGREADASFHIVAGGITAHDLKGKLRFDTGSGDIRIDRLAGRIDGDTGSGDVIANDVTGEHLGCDTGSGSCRIKGFKGETIDCDTGSGNVVISGGSAASIKADTGSGNIRIETDRVERVQADTGSGNIALLTSGLTLKRVAAETGSGNVRFGLGPEASFELIADQGSGTLRSGYADAQPILNGRELIGYRRGTGGARIDVDTGSGNVTIEPDHSPERKATMR